MGVQGRINPDGDKGDDQAKADATKAMDQKRKAQEDAKSIGQQVREKINEQYQGTT